MKKVSFECVGYSSKVVTQPVRARHGAVRPEIGHVFANQIIFFYFQTEWAESLHRHTTNAKLHVLWSFRNVKSYFKGFFLHVILKTFWVKFTKTAPTRVSWILVTYVILSATLQNSIIMELVLFTVIHGCKLYKKICTELYTFCIL